MICFTVQRDKGDNYMMRGRWLLASGVALGVTMELPDKDNTSNESCIPAGVYVVEWLRSERHSKLAGKDVYKWTIRDVPGRGGIEIDIANWPSQIKGCIAVGTAFADSVDGQGAGITGSRDAYVKLQEIVRNSDAFQLTIINPSLPMAV
jgi:hypothetical protein